MMLSEQLVYVDNKPQNQSCGRADGISISLTAARPRYVKDFMPLCNQEGSSSAAGLVQTFVPSGDKSILG